MGSQAFAKERDLEPLEDPGDCPIDAPVRVASVDSLRQFEGLIGHCPETSVIESPAYQANRPRGEIRSTIISNDGDVPGDRNAPAPQDDRNGRFILASKTAVGTAKGEAAKAASGVAVVAIVPPQGSTREKPASANAGASEQTDETVQAVLALQPQSYRTRFDGMIDSAARTHRVDPLLLHAVIKQESRYRDRAVSSAGARGLMQVMPGTGRDLGVKNPQQLFDPSTNINAGAKLLSQLWRRLDGDLDLVLAAYNAGEGAVRRHGMRIPPYRETQDYVAKVKANYARLAGENGIAVNF